MLDVDLQRPLQAEGARFAVHQRQHLNAECALKLGEFVQLIVGIGLHGQMDVWLMEYKDKSLSL